MSGNYSSFVEQKEQKLLTEAKNYEKQQKEIAALEDFVNRNLVRASTTKRAQSRASSWKNGAPRQARSWNQVCPYDLPF